MDLAEFWKAGVKKTADSAEWIMAFIIGYIMILIYKWYTGTKSGVTFTSKRLLGTARPHGDLANSDTVFGTSILPRGHDSQMDNTGASGDRAAGKQRMDAFPTERQMISSSM